MKYSHIWRRPGEGEQVTVTWFDWLRRDGTAAICPITWRTEEIRRRPRLNFRPARDRQSQIHAASLSISRRQVSVEHFYDGEFQVDHDIPVVSRHVIQRSDRFQVAFDTTRQPPRAAPGLDIRRCPSCESQPPRSSVDPERW